MRRHCLSSRRGGSSWSRATALCPSRAMLPSALSVSALFGDSCIMRSVLIRAKGAAIFGSVSVLLSNGPSSQLRSHL